MTKKINIENKTTWNTQELKKLFNLISKHEGYYPRKIYVVYSRNRGIVTGRGTLGPGWVKMRLPNKMYMYGALCTLGELSGSMLKDVAQTYIHELDHNRQLRHKDMVFSSKINVDYMKGIKIHRMTTKRKPTRVRLKPFIYKGFKIKIYKYPHRIEKTIHKIKVIEKTKTRIRVVPLKSVETTFGYRYTFLIYKNNKLIFRISKIFMENTSKLKKHIKKVIDKRAERWKR